MEKVKVICNLPTKLPIQPTIVLGLLLDRLNANGVVWGVCITIMAIWWVFAIVIKRTEKLVTLNPDEFMKVADAEKTPETPRQKTFQQKLNEMSELAKKERSNKN